jgi:hypothetical protein
LFFFSNDHYVGTSSPSPDALAFRSAAALPVFAAQTSPSTNFPAALLLCVDLFLYTLQQLLSIGSSSPCPATRQHPMVRHPRQPKTGLSTASTTVSAASYSRIVSLPTHEPLVFNDANWYEAWHSAMRKEIQALLANKTWTLVSFHPSMNVVGGRQVYRIKRRFDGSIERYKASLVARDFTQQEGIDYSKTFSPIIKQATVRLVFSIIISYNWKIHQRDIHNTFLNGILDEEVYMK